MSKSVKRSTAALAATDATTTSPPSAKINPKGNGPQAGSKQACVIAMLQSPTGTTIAAMMQATDWQQHSVRGFLAGVVRKRLKLKLESRKIDGSRVYRIVEGPPRRSKPPQSRRRSPLTSCRALESVRPHRTARHSTPKLRGCAISASSALRSGITGPIFTRGMSLSPPG